jgi:hypothetical protein
MHRIQLLPVVIVAIFQFFKAGRYILDGQSSCGRPTVGNKINQRNGTVVFDAMWRREPQFVLCMCMA